MKKCTRHKYVFNCWIEFYPESAYTSVKQMKCLKCSKIDKARSSWRDEDFITKLKKVTCSECNFIHAKENTSCIAELAEKIRVLQDRLDSVKISI